jgi:hypothetical protein
MVVARNKKEQKKKTKKERKSMLSLEYRNAIAALSHFAALRG